MPLARLLTGHGPPVSAHDELIGRRFAQHRRRCRRIILALETGPLTAYGVAAKLWNAATVREQPMLVVWEVLGHIDLLLAAGVAHERVDDDGHRSYSLIRQPQHNIERPGGRRLVHAR
jgi:hypothetical protein